MRQGGYDEGYALVPCFWGVEPSSLVKDLLSLGVVDSKMRVLDLGCGEGKNSASFARLGCRVDAVDCSSQALINGRAVFSEDNINWLQADAVTFPCGDNEYDIVLCYGLLHCLKSHKEIDLLLTKCQATVRPGGWNVICAFNDRSHDLAAHPGFAPMLLPHAWYVARYVDWKVSQASDSDLYETHPHNGIAHHHSMTRILARKP